MACVQGSRSESHFTQSRPRPTHTTAIWAATMFSPKLVHSNANGKPKLCDSRSRLDKLEPRGKWIPHVDARLVLVPKTRTQVLVSARTEQTTTFPCGLPSKPLGMFDTTPLYQRPLSPMKHDTTPCNTQDTQTPSQNHVWIVCIIQESNTLKPYMSR